MKQQKIRSTIKTGVPMYSKAESNKRLAQRRARRNSSNQIRYISKKEVFDPLLRLASAIAVNAFEEYRKSLTGLKHLPQSQKGGRIEKRLKIAIKSIKEDMLTNDNPSILYLLTAFHPTETFFLFFLF